MDARKTNTSINTFKTRVCNSDEDATDGTTANCVKPEFPYKEVRIAPGNWESSIVIGWLYQILLSEVFGVPVTIETGSFDASQDEMSKRQHGSFYDTESRFVYPDQVYPVGHLVEADDVGDCSLTDKPCAHILPEVWEGSSNSEITSAQEEGNLMPNMESNGIIGETGYFIPSFTAKMHVSFASFYGMRGEEHRAKLADTFKEPTTWADYCELVDPTNCTAADNKEISKRFPRTAEERHSYFAPDLYSGHFRVTDLTNCTKNPDTCTGHVIGPHCSWTTYVDSQMYWNDIGLTLNGPLPPNNGYSYSHMVQIWRAANATKSHVFFWWWTPDRLVDEFGASEDYSFQRVLLPTPTDECINYREKELNNQKCSDDIEVRKGEPIGSCDYGAISLQKITSLGLETSSLAGGVEAAQSPAYDFLKQIALPQYSLSKIFRQWSKLSADNGTMYDAGYAARESLCEWVYDNQEQLTRFSPKSFPRKKKSESYSALSYVGYVLGSVALILAIIVAICMYIWRDQPIIKSAQLNVLTAMIAGYILAGLSAVFHAVTETSDAICTLQQWTLRLCYCLELVPILIKISAINALGREARLLRKVQIDHTRFKKLLVMSITMLLAYLIIWTSVDIPKRTDDFEIIEGEVTIVAFHAGCASSSTIWGNISLAVESFVLISATILAYQSREIIGMLDESHWLAFLVYSHSVFLMIRVMIQVLLLSGMIKSALSTKIMAIVVALETIAAMLVYFLPKFVTIRSKKATKTVIVQTLRSSQTGSLCGPKNRGRLLHISGIQIPEGGIPNLIKKKPAGDISPRISSASSNHVVSSCISNASFDEDEEQATLLQGRKSPICKRVIGGGNSLQFDDNRHNVENERLKDEIRTLRAKLRLMVLQEKDVKKTRGEVQNTSSAVKDDSLVSSARSPPND